MLIANKMNTRIKIEKRTTIYEKGIKKETWEEYYSCWCAVLDLIGKEKYDAYNSKLENSIKFKCRTCKLLKDILFETKEYRVVWKDKVLSIVFVDTMGNSKDEIILQALVVN